ncbi:hypothetical protein BT69DRAFT_433104 [Atractiella rhizophila]|nr:hypothetical protein BT69DRAFT_433104 [Atractiella rhizophila]
MTGRGTGSGSERMASGAGSLSTSNEGSRNTRGTRQTSGSSNPSGSGSGSGRGGGGGPAGNSSSGESPSVNSDDLFYSRPPSNPSGGRGAGPSSGDRQYGWNLRDVGRAAAATVGLGALVNAKGRDSDASSPESNVDGPSGRSEMSRPSFQTAPTGPSTDQSVYGTATSGTATPAGAYQSVDTLNPQSTANRSSSSLTGAVRQGSAYSSTYGMPDVYASGSIDTSVPSQETPASSLHTPTTTAANSPQRVPSSSPSSGSAGLTSRRENYLPPIFTGRRTSTIAEESESLYSSEMKRRSGTGSESHSTMRPVSVGSTSSAKEGIGGVLAGLGIRLFGAQRKGTSSPRETLMEEKEPEMDEKLDPESEESSSSRHPILRDNPPGQNCNSRRRGNRSNLSEHSHILLAFPTLFTR